MSLSEEQIKGYFFQLKVWQLGCGLGMQVKGMGKLLPPPHAYP